MSEIIIDIHTHLFHITEHQLLAEMERAGVTCVVVSTVEMNPLSPELRAEIESKLKRRFEQSSSWHRVPAGFWSFQQIEAFFTEFASVAHMPTSEEIAEVVRRHPEKLIGFGSLDLHGDEDYIERKLAEITRLNLKGIGELVPTFQFFNPSENKNFARMCEYCEKNNKIILYHCGCDPGPFEIPELSEDANPKYLMPVLDRYSPIIIIAHVGAYSAFNPGIWLNEALELMRKYENVYADTSAVGHVIYRERNIERMRDIGIERFLFGSDYPTVSGSDIKYEVDRVKNCPYLTEEEKTKILGLNAANLLKL